MCVFLYGRTHTHNRLCVVLGELIKNFGTGASGSIQLLVGDIRGEFCQ